MNKNETDRLIESLADKTLSFGVKFKYKEEWDDTILTFVCSYWDTGNTTSVCHLWKKDSESTINDFKIENCEILGHPIMIGDVLGKMKEKYFKTWNLVKSDELLYLWADCGLTRSFQEIVNNIDWNNKNHYNTCEYKLAEFLISIFNDKS